MLYHAAAPTVIAFGDPATAPTIFSLLNASAAAGGAVEAGAVEGNDAAYAGGGAAAPGSVDGPLVIAQALVLGAVRLRAIQYSPTSPCAAFGGLLASAPAGLPASCLAESGGGAPAADYGSRASLPVLPQRDLASDPSLGNAIDLHSASLAARRAAVDAVRPRSFNPLPSAAAVAAGAAPAFVSQATRSLIIDLTLYVPSTATLAAVRLYAYAATAGSYVTAVRLQTMRAPDAAPWPPAVFTALTVLHIALHALLLAAYAERTARSWLRCRRGCGCWRCPAPRAQRHDGCCAARCGARADYCCRLAQRKAVSWFLALIEVPGGGGGGAEDDGGSGTRRGGERQLLWLLSELLCAALLCAVLALQQRLQLSLAALDLRLDAPAVFFPVWPTLQTWQTLRDLIAVVVFLLCVRFLSALGSVPLGIGSQLTALLRTLSSLTVLVSVALVLCFTLIAGLAHAIAFGADAVQFASFTQAFFATFAVSYGSDISGYAGVAPRLTTSVFFVLWLVLAALLFNLLIASVSNRHFHFSGTSVQDWHDELTLEMSAALLQSCEDDAPLQLAPAAGGTAAAEAAAAEEDRRAGEEELQRLATAVKFKDRRRSLAEYLRALADNRARLLALALIGRWGCCDRYCGCCCASCCDIVRRACVSGPRVAAPRERDWTRLRATLLRWRDAEADGGGGGGVVAAASGGAGAAAADATAHPRL